MVQSEPDPRFPPRPIVLITGGTGAVGFGICLRLLYQLSQPIQVDLSTTFVIQSTHENVRLNHETTEEEEDQQSLFATPNGLTLLIGCRSETKYRTTRKELKRELRKLINNESKTDQEDVKFSYIDRQTGQVETIKFEEYRSSWLDKLIIDWLPLDLYQAQSVLKSIKLVNDQYGYLTHLLLNAGGGPFVAISWFGLFRAFIRDLRKAITYPDYLIQSPKVLETIDGISETWQLNVFSHYLLARESLNLLVKGSEKFSSCKTRIIWTGSLDGQSIYFNSKDLECIKLSSHAYQSTKYQSELLGQGFNETISNRGFNSQVISLVAHPGVVAGNMFTQIIGKMMDMMMVWVFYFARLILGSPHHLIDGYLAGLVWTKLCLTEDPIKIQAEEKKNESRLIRFGAQCDRWGHPFVVKEDSVDSDDQINIRFSEQRIVIDHCEQKANALIRLLSPP